MYKRQGFYCIGCGTGRMCYSLLHLDIVTAARCNILALIAVPLIGYTMLRYGIKTVSYTHLDVYKRQALEWRKGCPVRPLLW